MRNRQDLTDGIFAGKIRARESAVNDGDGRRVRRVVGCEIAPPKEADSHYAEVVGAGPIEKRPRSLWNRSGFLRANEEGAAIHFLAWGNEHGEVCRLYAGDLA